MIKVKTACGMSNTMNWNQLTSEDQVDQIQQESGTNPVIIFKYSNRCSVSRVALDRLERKWRASEMTHVKTYFLDLISHRRTSDKVAHQFGVPHESPQVLVIHRGAAVLDQSHFGIDYDTILEAIRD